MWKWLRGKVLNVFSSPPVSDVRNRGLEAIGRVFVELRAREKGLLRPGRSTMWLSVPSDFRGRFYELHVLGPEGCRRVILPEAFLLWSVMPVRLWIGTDGEFDYVAAQEVA